MNPKQPKHPATLAKIASLLRANFTCDQLEVIDNSYLHATHQQAIAQPDKGHFHIRIDAASLGGDATSLVAKHKKIYQCLSPIMRKIHALEITIV